MAKKVTFFLGPTDTEKTELTVLVVLCFSSASGSQLGVASQLHREALQRRTQGDWANREFVSIFNHLGCSLFSLCS